MVALCLPDGFDGIEYASQRNEIKLVLGYRCTTLPHGKSTLMQSGIFEKASLQQEEEREQGADRRVHVLCRNDAGLHFKTTALPGALPGAAH